MRSPSTRISPLVIIVVVVLTDLLGFTLVVPLLPPFARQYGFTPSQIGWLLAAYPLCQLIAGPILGRLSDRVGRRPVLVLSQMGTAVSFLMLGLSRDYTIMLLARALDGASGGNILVAQAYVADVTRPEERAKGYGMIGAAFGLGFVLGPILGAVLLAIVPEASPWRLRVPFLVAAGFSTLAWLLVWLRLPESLTEKSQARETARVLSWRGIADTISDRGIGLLVAVGSLSTLAFAALEGTLSLFLQDRIGWGPGRQVLAFAFIGVVSVLVQGGLIRALVPRFGETRLMVVGLFTVALGFPMMALVPQGGWLALLGALLVVGVGQGIASPCIQGLLSRQTPASEQGAVFGTLNSAQTLARMINYVVANRLLIHDPSTPYWEAGVIATVALILAGFWVASGSGKLQEISDLA